MLKKTECFKIQLLKNEKGISFDINSYKPILEIPCESLKIFGEPTMIVADPFLFQYKERLFLFFESKKLYKNGVIMMMNTSDLINWSEPVVVLEEKFHLSYPWVFEENGHIYMIPEVGETKSIRLYEAVNNELTEFEFVKELLHEKNSDKFDVSFADTSILKKDGYYYLHTTINKDCVNHLKLFYSRKLDGIYEEHKMSPIVISNKKGRNAGSLFRYGDMIIRPAQDCVKNYGDNVHLMKVNKVDVNEYEEEEYMENVLDRNKAFFRNGGHQFNIIQFKGCCILATDAKEYHYYFYNKLLHKLGLY